MFDQVKEYVSKMRDLGYSEEKIKFELTNSGWSDNIINDALTNTEITMPLAPTPGSPLSAVSKTSNDVKTHDSLMVGFLYVLNFISLWIGSISFILVIHTLIDKAFPRFDPYQYMNSLYSTANYVLNGYIAAMVVTAPVFLFLFIYLKKQVTKHPEYRLYKFRKFLIIITLVAAFLTLVIDLISVLTNFLNGDVTIGFILKVVTIIVVLVPIFIYYYHEITSDKKQLK